MRCLVFLFCLFILQGCTQDYCGMLDLQQFKSEEELHSCDLDKYTDDEMEACVKIRHAHLYQFHDEYGISYGQYLQNFEQYRDLLNKDGLSTYGPYLLVMALHNTDPSNPNLVAAVNFLLTEGVDPFRPYKTADAPVGSLLEGVGVARATSETKAWWDLVKKYYPPKEYELSKQVDLYIRHCRVKY